VDSAPRRRTLVGELCRAWHRHTPPWLKKKTGRGPWVPGNDESFLLKYFFDGEYRVRASGSTGAASGFIYIFSIWIKRYRRRQKYQGLLRPVVASAAFLIAIARRFIGSDRRPWTFPDGSRELEMLL